MMIDDTGHEGSSDLREALVAVTADSITQRCRDLQHEKWISTLACHAFGVAVPKDTPFAA
jgi:hypothetical protein